jgi:NADPH2:quinone reductase
MSDVPHLMRALVAEEKGQPLRLMQISTPRAGPGQVLVHVAASGVNPLDIKIRAGAAEHARQPLPAVLGMDVAGVVVGLGEDVTEFRLGDGVFGMAGGVGGHPGSLAEYMAADVMLLAPKPAGLTMREAAALPLVFITAWEGLVDRAGVHAGQRVLVLGGAGGVGQMALQIARARGAAIYGAGSPAAWDAIERLGAVFVDKAHTPAETVSQLPGGQGFDIVYDTAGGPSLDAAFAMVRRFGHVVSALGWGAHALAPLSFRAATYSGVFTLLPLLTGEGRDHHGAILREAVRLVDAGKLTPSVDPRRFTLDTANDAYRAIETGNVRGKLVVDIGEETAP